MLTLNDGRNELWQWDTKRKLTVDAECSQVHFSNKVFGRSIDMDVVDGVAIVPDILLQTDKDLNAWAFVGTAENGYTKISKTFKVNRRNKPADYVFTPHDQTSLEEIKEKIEYLESIQNPDAIKNAVDDYLANNPIMVKETDPTVPEWAKQPTPPDVKIPDKLPNPHSITFTGAVDASYDGSNPVEIKIPDSGGNAVQYVTQELTEGQKAQARENIGAAQQYTFVDSVAQMTNTDKEYILKSTGEIWSYQLIERETMLTPNFTNLFDKSKVVLNKTFNMANNPPKDLDGVFLTGPYAYDFTDYDVSNPVTVRIKGISLDDCFATDGRWARVVYYRFAVPADMTTENFRMYMQFNAHVPYTVASDGTIAFPLVLKKDGSIVGEYDLMQAFAFSFPISKSAITLNDVPDLIVTIDEEITYTETPGSTFYEWRSTGEKYTDAYIENRFITLEKDVSDFKTREEETVFSDFSCENDFTIVGDEVWGSKNEDTYTRIVRHKILDGALVKLGEIMLSDVIHLNTMDYCPENDCLITGNGANDQNTEGNCFWIIPNASKLPNLEGTLSLADIAIRYDVDIGYKVQAIWGNGNLGQHNLVYLCSNDKEVREAIIHKNTDGSFANTYTIVSDPFVIEGAAGYQGMDYYGGSIYFGCADFTLAKTNTHNFTAEVTKYKYFNTDGTAIDGVFQGVVVDKDYLWLYPSGTTELIRYTR